MEIRVRPVPIHPDHNATNVRVLDTLQQCALQKKKKVMFASEMNSNTIPESSTGDQEMKEAEIEEFEEERLQASELPLCVVH
jgi:hypothetical protein